MDERRNAYDAVDESTVEPVESMIAQESQSLADDLAELKASVEAPPAKRQMNYDREKRLAAARKAAETRKAKGAAKEAAKKAAQERANEARRLKRAAAGKTVEANVSSSLVAIDHLRAAKALVVACGDGDRARAALDAYLSI